MSSIVREDICNVVQRVKALERLSGKNILIAGGTGFVGTHLVETIAFLNSEIFEKPCRVFVVTRNPGRFGARCPHLCNRKDIVFLRGDVRTFQHPPDPCCYVVHAASSADPATLLQDPLETMDVIVGGTKRLLSLASEWKSERFIYLSSGAVYGPQPSRMSFVSESYHGGPDIEDYRAVYGEAKRLGEVLCQVFRVAKLVPVSIARLFAFVGPYMDPDSSFAIMDFIRQALRGETIRIKGNGQAIRALCYSADMTVALWNILLLGENGGVYNVGSDREMVTIEELACRVSNAMDRPLKISVEGQDLEDVVRPRYVPDITKIKTHFDFSLHYDLDTSIRRTLGHLLGRIT